MKSYTIFCDDVREEVNNKRSYIGVYGDDLLVNKFPFLIPKFFVVPHFILESEDKLPDKIKTKISFPGGNIETESILKGKKPEKNSEKMARVVIVSEISPFVVESEGPLTIQVKLDKKKFTTIGKLNIKNAR